MNPRNQIPRHPYRQRRAPVRARSPVNAPSPGEPGAASAPLLERRGAAAGGRKTLIVADDEVAVRSLLRCFLEADGYRVLAVSEPEEALRLAEGADRIDGLVTDVFMPEMDGRELARRLRERRPGLPVLFVSASAEAAAAMWGAPRDQGFLAKPFDHGGLARAVADVLGRG